MMQPDIVNSFGTALQQEISTLLENLGGMTDIIEANFSQIKDILQSHKEDVIKAITKEKEEIIKAIAKEKEDAIKAKNNEISDLKSKIEAKEVQINSLK
jgi:Na+/phosphate symporter